MDKKYLHLIKWLLKRFGYSRRVFLEWIDSLIYQPKSRALLHAWHGHRTPFEMILFYNLLGRILFASREFLALVTDGKLFKKKILLEGYEESERREKKGSYDALWPRSPIGESSYNGSEESILSEALKERMKKSLEIAYRVENLSFSKTKEWERVTTVFKSSFFTDDGELNEELLLNFRSTSKRCEEIFGDEFYYVDREEGYTKSYLKAIDLLLSYHRIAKVINKELLASVTESSVGNSLFVNYRGQRLSEKLLFHTMIVNDILEGVTFEREHRNVVVDIGSGYGGVDRLLSYYVPNACFVLVDLPETLLLTSYFIEYNFPDKKVALLSDIIDRVDEFESLVMEYDFIVIPPSVVEKIPDESVNLVLNSASLGFMEQEYIEYYLKHIYRTLKRRGYFYSLNKEYNSHLGIGNHEWDFQGEYLTKLMAYDNRFSYMQWLGEKL